MSSKVEVRSRDDLSTWPIDKCFLMHGKRCTVSKSVIESPTYSGRRIAQEVTGERVASTDSHVLSSIICGLYYSNYTQAIPVSDAHTAVYM